MNLLFLLLFTKMVHCLIYKVVILDEAKVYKLNSEKSQVIYVLVMIVAISIAAFLSMKLISPYSKALGSFLLGFALVFIFVTLLALYIKYIVDLYREIRSLQ